MGARQAIQSPAFLPLDGQSGRPNLTISGVAPVSISSTGIIDLSTLFNLGNRQAPLQIEGFVKMISVKNASAVTVTQLWKYAVIPVVGASDTLVYGAIPTGALSNSAIPTLLAASDINEAMGGIVGTTVNAFYGWTPVGMNWNLGAAAGTSKIHVFAPIPSRSFKVIIMFANLEAAGSGQTVPTDTTQILHIRPAWVQDDFGGGSAIL